MNKHKKSLILGLIPVVLFSVSIPLWKGVDSNKAEPSCLIVQDEKRNRYEDVNPDDKYIKVLGDNLKWPVKEPGKKVKINLTFTIIPPSKGHINDFYIFSEQFVRIYYINNPKNRDCRKKGYMKQVNKKLLKEIGPITTKNWQQRYEINLNFDEDNMGKFGYIAFDHWDDIVKRFGRHREKGRMITTYFAIGYTNKNSQNTFTSVPNRDTTGSVSTIYSKERNNFVSYRKTYNLECGNQVPKFANNSNLDISSFTYSRKYKFWPVFYIQAHPPYLPNYKGVKMWLEIYGKDHNVFYPYRSVTNSPSNKIIIPINLIPKYSEDKECCIYDAFDLEYCLNNHVFVNGKYVSPKKKLPIPRHDARKKEIFYKICIDEKDDKSVEKIEIPLITSDYINEIGGCMTSERCVAVKSYD